MHNPENTSEVTPVQPRTTFDWVLWFQWLLATTLGWVLGLVLGGEVGIGLFVGLAQWLVLRRYLSGAGWWILASTIGWFLGWAIITSGLIVPPGGGLVASMIAGAVFGLTMGVAQWIILRNWVNVAGMWMLLSVPGWTLGLLGLLGMLLVGVVVGVITGFGLDFLLRFPRAGITLKN